MPEATLQDPVPGTVVPSGALVSPGGPIGGAGANAWTLTTASFTVPNVGSTVVVSVNDTRWCVIGEFVYVASGDLLKITAITATTLTLLNPPSNPGVSADPGQSATLGSDQLILVRALSTWTTASFTMPGYGSSVTISVADTSWMSPGDILKVVLPTNQDQWMGVSSIGSGTSVTVVNNTGYWGSGTVPANTVVCQGSMPQAGPTSLGAVPTPPNDVTQVFRGNASWGAPPTRDYYGTDTTNSTNFVVTVDSSFALVQGVVVFVTPTNGCTNNPTLNVNGTGAKNIVNRANIQLSTAEIIATKTFGVVYDGTSWRVITPLTRVYQTTTFAGGALTIECAGYDNVNAYIGCTTATALSLTLAHIGQGIPLVVEIFNGAASAMNYTVAGTNETGGAIGAYFCWANAVTGAALTALSTASALGAGLHMVLSGANRTGPIVFL